MRKLFLLMAFVSVFVATGKVSKAAPPSRQYFELRVYHASDTQQLRTINNFLQSAFLPALHRHGFKKIGVFSAISNDTAADKRIYVLIPYASLKDIETLSGKLDKDQQFQKEGAGYLDAIYSNPPYKRYEAIILKAFELMPEMARPQLNAAKSERVYELRSYEGYTEKIYRNKVQMFNAGGEIDIFKRLGFNAVFYGEVLFGSRMPNLMYMTSFENKAARDEHWKAFSSDPAWKTLSSQPQYQHNVSKSEIIFLRPADFSDL